MRRFFVCLFMLGLAMTVSAETTGRGGLYFGQKSLDHNDWGDLDSHAAWGIDVDAKDVSWPVWATFGYLSSRDEVTAMTSLVPFSSQTIEAKTMEIRTGIKKDFFPVKKVRVSIAGGPAWIRAKLGRTVAPFNSESDSTLGVWAGADAYLFVGPFILGVAYHFSHGEVDLLGASRNAGGNNLAFSVGIGW